MSFFFDVWTVDGFVLASDVILLEDGKQRFFRKIAHSSLFNRVNCAIAVCGDYPENCLDYFKEATATKDSLRDVAECFAQRWTDRYAGTSDYSAVHLVGFERINESNDLVQQMWYWRNWDNGGYLPEAELRNDLASFSKPIPSNNHIPWKIKQLEKKFPIPSLPLPSLQGEKELVTWFLNKHQPYFTWNGDQVFWRNAADSVGSALRLLREEKDNWTLEECIELTDACLHFLVRVGALLPAPTVSLDPEGSVDLVKVEPTGATWIRKSKLPPDSEDF